MKKVFITILIIAFAVCGFSACGSEPAQQEEDWKDEQQNQISEREWKDAYIEILEENQNDINAFTWQVDKEGDFDRINGQCALCDINSDNVPELFFMKATGEIEAQLYIYTYSDKTAVEVTYAWDDFVARYEHFQDVLAGGGNAYILYKGKENGNFYIYHKSINAYSIYTVSRYDLDGTQLTRTMFLANEWFPPENTPDGYGSDMWWLDGDEIDGETFEKHFSAARDDMDQVIIYSYHDETSMWNMFSKEDALCQSYDSIMEELKN